MTLDSHGQAPPDWLSWTDDGLAGEWARRRKHQDVAKVLAKIAAKTGMARPAAVLVLFGGTDAAEPGGLPGDADVLLTQRAATMRQHGGQVAFPGGAMDPGDEGPVGTALREAQEETGLDPSGVQPLATLPSVYVPPSGYEVTPVLGYWRTPSPVRVTNAESQRVVRVPIAQLADPANRFQVRGPMGYRSPAFAVEGMLVWGLTGGILADLLTVAGWERAWDVDDVRDLAATLAQFDTTTHDATGGERR